MAKIADLLDILATPARITQIIREELTQIQEQFGDARRSTIVENAQDMSMEDLIKPEEMVVTLSHGGYMKSQPMDDYRAQKRGGRGKQAAGTKDEDFIEKMFVANTHDYILCFSNRGRLYWLKVYNVPAGRTHRARQADRQHAAAGRRREDQRAVAGQEPSTTSTTCSWPHPTASSRKPRCRNSRVRRTAGIIAVGLDEGDFLIGASITDGRHDVMLFSDGGKAVRFDENDVRPMGRTARGVIGMKLAKGKKLISLLVAEDENEFVLTATENGFGKRTPITEYTRHGRGDAGHDRDPDDRAQRQGGRCHAGEAGRRNHADHHRWRADPHPRQGNPRHGPRDAGRAH